MFYFSFFTFVLVALSIVIHGIAINYLAIAKIKSINYLTFAKFSLVLFCSHLAHIFLFAIFYAYSFRHLGPTELFAGNLQDSFVDFFYFSITTYTTLGIGDVYPLGNMRIV
ncbi:MAG: ion channel, partial [Methylophilaceae bacterium]